MPTGGPAAGFVGRVEELAAVRAVVEAACEGRAGTLLVQGEAGVGKTELVVRVLLEADEHAMVVRGTALPMTSMTVPYLPLRSALARLGEAGPAPGEVFDDGKAGEGVPLAFDAWVTARCRDRPMVLAVDDLHWADASTLDALLYLLSGPPDRRLAVLLTLRHGEVREGHRLNRWLADVRRLPRFRPVSLGPFDRVATEQQITGLLGAPPHQSLVDDVFARTRGNAYLTRLLVTGLAREARNLPAALPGDLEGALLASWHQLSAPTRDLTKVIAIGGRRVTLAELATFLTPEDRFGDVGGLLREAAQAAVLDQAPDGSYWFHHPLQAQVLAGRIPDDERRFWHARFARHLEGLFDPEVRGDADLLAAVADHHHRAGHPAAAYAWARRAAALAGASGGAREQIRLLRRALDLRDHAVPIPSRLELLLELQDAALRAGDFVSELDTLEELLAETDDDHDPMLRAELLLRRGEIAWAAGRAFLSHDDVEHALELTSHAPESWQHAFALAERAHVAVWATDPRAGELADEAIAAARRTGHPKALAYALTAGAMVAAVDERTDDGLALADEARRHALAAQDYSAYVGAGFWEYILHAPFASLDGIEVLARYRRELQGLAGPHPYVAWLAAGEAGGLVALGRGNRAAEPLRIALGATPGGFADVMTRLTAARLAAFQGRLEEALAHLQRADELCEDLSAFPSLETDVVRAEVLLAAGNPQAALASALHGAALPETPPSMAERLIPLAARSLAELIEDVRAQGQNIEPLLTQVDDLAQRFPDVISENSSSPVYRTQLAACTAWYAAELGRARRDPNNAAAWEDFVRLAAAAELRWDVAYAGLHAARAHLSAGPGHRQAATEALHASRRLAEELGARPVLDALDDLATTARLTPRAIDPDETSATTDLPGLTPREQEVLTHIVGGHTYREIAQALVVSEKTVSTHVSNMLQKYGLTNRVELAQLATRKNPNQ